LLDKLLGFRAEGKICNENTATSGKKQRSKAEIDPFERLVTRSETSGFDG
jgi:hypothetical protein